LLGVAGLIVLQFGGTVFAALTYGLSPVKLLSESLTGTHVILNNLLVEFSFPYINLARVIDHVPDVVGYRWWSDVPSSVLNVLPGTIPGLQPLTSTSQINTTFYETTGEIPVDLLTYGFYALGPTGVMVTCSLFAYAVSRLDARIGQTQHRVVLMIYVALIFRVSFLVMYGDPKQLVMTNLDVILAGIGILVMYILFRGMQYHRDKVAR
jgi:hypothetical protein